MQVSLKIARKRQLRGELDSVAKVSRLSSSNDLHGKDSETIEMSEVAGLVRETSNSSDLRSQSDLRMSSPDLDCIVSPLGVNVIPM